jgi:hypothetical protein
MPRAVLAIRSYPITMLIALCVFLLTLAITTGSLGTVGGGGDDGDGGSGMGGTGKSGEFGGSGFGGTGAPSPFFGLIDPEPADANSPDETAHQETPQPSGLFGVEETTIAIYEAPTNIPVITPNRNVQADDAVADVVTPPAQLTENLQVPLDINPLTEEIPTRLAQPSPPVDLTNDATSSNGPESRLAFSTADQVNTDQMLTRTEETLSEAAGSTESLREESESIKPEPLQQLAEANAPANTSDGDASSETLDRSNLPERIQRPELPPFQRITPVQRPTLLPPRVQPMRI